MAPCHTEGMTTQALDTQIHLNATDYVEVYDADAIRLYTSADGVTADVELNPRQARQLARLLLQYADDTEV